MYLKKKLIIIGSFKHETELEKHILLIYMLIAWIKKMMKVIQVIKKMKLMIVKLTRIQQIGFLVIKEEMKKKIVVIKVM